MAEENGNSVELPSLHVGWDAETNTVRLEFDPKEFKNWFFIQAVLLMAAQQAEQNGRMAIMAGMQQQQIAARSRRFAAQRGCSQWSREIR